MAGNAAVGLLDDAQWRGRIFGGDWETAQGGRSDVIEPATGEVVACVGLGNAADIAAAAKSAAAAQVAWAAMPPRERAAILRGAAAALEREFDALALFVSRETGGIIPKGQHEMREAITLFHMAAGMALQPQGVMLPSVPGKTNLARRVPLGVVGVISPFNFPLILSLRAVAPALATGNAVVLKPDPRTPVSGGVIIARALEEAGLPKGVLHVVPGEAKAGEALCVDPHVAMIGFTGSTTVGRRIAELAGKHLKKVSLELGGKNSLIILDDADLERAAACAAWGAYLHQGQICMASGRILVHEKVATELTARLVAKAAHMPVGNPVDQVALGPIIDTRQRERVHAIVQDTIKEGGRLEVGGSHDGNFYRPTVLSGVRPGMRAYRDEFFGPVASVITFRSDDEAIELANDTEGCLAAGVISRSVGRAMAIAERLNAGMVHVNDQTVADECTNPFGGHGSSGNGGNVGGPSDWDNYTKWKWMTVKGEAPMYPF